MAAKKPRTGASMIRAKGGGAKDIKTWRSLPPGYRKGIKSKLRAGTLETRSGDTTTAYAKGDIRGYVKAVRSYRTSTGQKPVQGAKITERAEARHVAANRASIAKRKAAKASKTAKAVRAKSITKSTSRTRGPGMTANR